MNDEALQRVFSLDALARQISEEKLKAGKVLAYVPGRGAPLKVSIWWHQIEDAEIGHGIFGVNCVERHGHGRTYIYRDNFEAAKVGFKSACEQALAMWAAKVMRPKKYH